MRRSLSLLSCLLLSPFVAHAEGEAVNGYPSWSERVLLEWINRARVDPQIEMANCPGGNCAEKACYTPQPPRLWNAHIAHSARFHSDAMARNNFFDHYSECALLGTVGTTYLSSPQTCNGAASCACTGGAISGVSGSGTDPYTRMGMFGASSTGGEIIARGGGGPDDSFYSWLYEASSTTQCAFTGANGHRFLILSSDYGKSSAGPGVSGALSTVDFDNEPTSNPKIPSGTHYPQQAASVDAWANWHDSAAPSAHQIDVDGVCSAMTLRRGTATNGAWHATVTGVGSGCHRYAFVFKDANGNTVNYPTTGSLGIGNGSALCPDWTPAAPTPCVDKVFADKFGG